MTAGEWMTTAPHPWRKAHRCGEDQNQVGWRLHYVESRRALCGLVAAHGWAVDLFIEQPCARCYAIAEQRGVPIPEAQVAEHENKMRMQRLLRGAP